MLTVRKGYDTDYLTEAVAKGREGYYTGAVAAGEPAGLWHGQGAAELGLSGEVDAETMKALYTHSLDPRDPATAQRATWGDAARLGNGPRNYKKADELYARLLEANPEAGPERRAELRAQAARSQQQSVAFWDVVSSAPKSMTVLWVACERAANDARAAGNHTEAQLWAERAKTVEEGLLVGHRATLDFLSEHAGYARAGHHGGGGGQWVDAHGLVATQFLQHDSRDKDPQLHVHGPILNKVKCADGKWRALDGTLITQWRDAAGAVGERVTEAFLSDKLGVAWRTRPDGKAREIVGIDPESSGLFSKRTAAITPAHEALLARFRAETGREPSNRERAKLADQATLATRRGKSFGGETRDGQIARWAAEHSQALGVELGDIARTVFATGRANQTTRATEAADQTETWSERDVVTRALATVAEKNQSWTRSQLMRAISDALPGDLGLAPEQIPTILDALTDKAQAQAQYLNPRSGPEGLDAKYYRADGQSVFVKPGAARYATSDQLLGEAELRAAAVRRGAPAWTVADADEVIARFARSGRTLSTDQAAALRGILTSGAAVEVLAAPAGTGKSFLVGTLAETWTHTRQPTPTPGGTPGEQPEPGDATRPRVFGVAYGQRQADVLTEEGVTARNITAWLAGQQRLRDGGANTTDEQFRLSRGDMLVVDEAGAADTAALVAIHRECKEAGAKLLLVGDTRQLAAVGAGGALGDIIDRGISYELAEVRRFRNQWEGPASLRLREGDTSVLGDYAKHGRLVAAGTIEQAEAAASRQWLADTLAGHDSLLVVGSNDAAARCSTALRSQLVRHGKVTETGVALGMQGTVAGVGDLIQARRNAWHLEGWRGNKAAPINRSTYRVLATEPDAEGTGAGGLTVARVIGRDAHGVEQLAEPMQLPASYVNNHVTLAYASTVHAAHGRTVGTSHGVVGPGTDAAAGYTLLTRGRDSNMAFVVTNSIATDYETGETHTVAERSAVDVLADVIRPPQVDRNRTALTESEDADAAARAVGTHVDPLIEVIAETLSGRTGQWLDELAAEGSLPEQHRVEFAADEARGTVEQLLRTAELAGHDPAQVLRDAVGAGSLAKAASVAQVLHFRVRSALQGKLTPRLGSFADLLPRHLPEQSRAGLAALAAVADARREELGDELAESPPQWAREALGPVPTDATAAAAWRQRAGWAASYRELSGHDDDRDPLGAAPPSGLAEKHALFRAAHDALDLPNAGAEEEAMTEGRLRARVAAYAREEAWAPRYVADELEATHDQLRRQKADAIVWANRAAAEPAEAVREQLRADADAAKQKAAQLAEQTRDLEHSDAARSEWWIETAVTRDKAERARLALGIRGIRLDTPEERVTAHEWLQAHQDEQRTEDPHREISEADLADTHDLDLGTEGGQDLDGRDMAVTAKQSPDTVTTAPELGADPIVLDIRDTSEVDEVERVDPMVRRRVPLPSETAATVDRAQRALAEIEARRDAEAAEAARIAAAETDVNEDAETRVAELQRYAHQDTTADAARTNSDEDDIGWDR